LNEGGGKTGRWSIQKSVPMGGNRYRVPLGQATADNQKVLIDRLTGRWGRVRKKKKKNPPSVGFVKNWRDLL